jgi:hypothetical protein
VPTPADLLSQIATAVQTQVSGVARLGSDYRDDLESIPAGATRYQLRGGPAGKDSSNSNTTRTVVAVELELIHALAGDERTWTEGAMQTHVEVFIGLAFWRDLAASYDVTAAPSYEVERVGRVVTTTIAVSLSVVP